MTKNITETTPEELIGEIVYTLNTYSISDKKLRKMRDILYMTEEEFKDCFEGH